jgi:hypothetical protein
VWKESPPGPKSLKERIVGVWVLDFSGDVKTTAEADAKKKAGKDEKKLADLMKKAEETAAKEKVESTGDTMILWDGDKTTSKAKYEIVKEEGNTLTLKRVGKDEISKKDVAATEIVITFKDETTIELKDPKEKDAKKAKLLVFKKSAAAASTSATPATPATPAAPASGAAGKETTSAKPADKGAAAGAAGAAKPAATTPVEKPAVASPPTKAIK